MSREPIAFLSYVRADDDHDDGRITAFRKRLEGEVRMQTGKPFAIFQDRNDIGWGTNWQERIESSLATVAFLIPVITPSFFQSPACRREFEIFSLREKTLGVNRLILPLYYVSCDQFDDRDPKIRDEIVDTLRERHWTDWRDFRFRSFANEEVSGALASLATMIKATSKDIQDIFAVADASTVKSAQNASLVAKARSTRSRPTEKAKESDFKEAVEKFSKQVTLPIAEARSRGVFDPQQLESARANGYYAYTRRFDEEVAASELASSEELLKLHTLVSKRASRLQNFYKAEIEAFTKSVRRSAPISVTFLCDNSGSMRGEKIYKLASWISVFIDVLEQLSVPSEVLGYTTRAWKGGQSRELWLKDKKPKLPGRLNDVRHIIYKSFAESARVAAPSLGVMVREGILKENVDGEAVLWANQRALKNDSETKLILVLADGASVDDSTISANSAAFLPAHAAAVANYVGSQLNVRLIGIGIGVDVSSIYKEAETATAEQIGPAVLRVLRKCLS